MGVTGRFHKASLELQGHLDIATIGQDLKSGAAKVGLRTPDQIGGADNTAHLDQKAVVLPEDQIAEADGKRFGQGSVMENLHIMALDDEAKAIARRSFDQYAITGEQFGVRGDFHKSGEAVILHKEQMFVATEVGYCGFKIDRKNLAGLGVAEGVNLAQ